MREQGSASRRQAERQPPRYYRAGNSSFDQIWR
jgi:hypothetical protein